VLTLPCVSPASRRCLWHPARALQRLPALPSCGACWVLRLAAVPFSRELSRSPKCSSHHHPCGKSPQRMTDRSERLRVNPLSHEAESPLGSGKDQTSSCPPPPPPPHPPPPVHHPLPPSNYLWEPDTRDPVLGSAVRGD
jgi:hypothetical protein